jgi:hypothetical protein
VEVSVATEARLVEETISCANAIDGTTSERTTHLSRIKLSHVFLNVKLKYSSQLPTDATRVLYPTRSMHASITWMESKIFK